MHKGHLVRAISIDESGEFVSACSDGGMVGAYFHSIPGSRRHILMLGLGAVCRRQVVVYTVSFPLSGLPPPAQASRASTPPVLPVSITQVRPAA